MISAHSQVMINVIEQVRSAGLNAIPLLITGETGTGKTLLAHEYHSANGSTSSIVSIVCPNLHTSLAESEIFGYKRGAFTGATHDREGLVAQADGGTLFLDEIGDLRPSIQAKFLGLLDNGAYRRVGDTREYRVNLRVVSATNRDIEQLVMSGEFRTDLLHRLRGIHVHIPPLRDRPEDIPDLVTNFINQESATVGQGAPTITESAIQLLANQIWPGNVRQLRMTVVSAFRSSAGNSVLTPSVIAPYITNEQYFHSANQHLVSIEGPMLDALQEYAHVMGYTRAEALAAWPDFWSRHGSFLQATMLVAWQNAISNAVAQEVKSCRKDTSVLATYLQTNSAKETARLTGVPISTVYYKIQQAKRRGGF